jgi:hypothetical protein
MVKGRIGFGGKRGLIWVLLASWLIPLMMTGAYIVLIATSEVDAKGASWEAVAFAFVLVLWFLFRMLTEHAALARAVDVGAADEIIELSDFQLQRRKGARSRMPYHVYRALAFDILEDWPAALAELDRTEPTGTFRPLATTVRVSALASTGKAKEARALFDAELVGRPVTRIVQADILTLLADARVKLAEGDQAAAAKTLAKLSEDVRAGSGIRARAKALLAKIGP